MGWHIAQPIFLSKSRLPAWLYFAVAVATVHRSVFTRLKRYFRILATLGTYRGKHLPLWSITITAASLAFQLPCLPTFGTTLGLVGVASQLEKLLVLSGEGKGVSAIGTLERLVLEIHRMTSSLFIWLETWSSEMCDNS